MKTEIFVSLSLFFCLRFSNIWLSLFMFRPLSKDATLQTKHKIAIDLKKVHVTFLLKPRRLFLFLADLSIG